MNDLARVAVACAVLGCALSPTRASAFCGFYVSGTSEELENATSMVVLFREGDLTVLSMRNDYRGPPEDFALVVPVPTVLRAEDVRTLPRALFDRVDRLAAPRLVAYEEMDPCAAGGDIDDLLNMSLGGGGGGARAARAYMAVRPRVRVAARFAVDEYDVVILDSDDSAALERWLHQHHYRIPRGAARYLRPYIDGGSYFLVARVDVRRLQFNEGRRGPEPAPPALIARRTSRCPCASARSTAPAIKSCSCTCSRASATSSPIGPMCRCRRIASCRRPRSIGSALSIGS